MDVLKIAQRLSVLFTMFYGMWLVSSCVLSLEVLAQYGPVFHISELEADLMS